MSQKIQIRRGTAAQLAAITPDMGEPCWTTDTLRLKIGDGTTAGGVEIVAGTVTAADILALDFSALPTENQTNGKLWRSGDFIAIGTL